MVDPASRSSAPGSPMMPTAEKIPQTQLNISFTAREVADVVNKMVSGKSPGYDHLSIEHLRYAGVHMHRVLPLFYSLLPAILTCLKI